MSVGVLHDPLGLILVPLAAVLVVAGAVALLWKRFTLGLFCMVLVGVTLVAGLVRQYPVADRLVLYLIPVAALVLGGTILLLPRHVLLVVVAIAVVSASTFSSAAIAVARPYVMTSGRDALAYAIRHAGPHDLVLIEGSASDLYAFYHQVAGVTVAGSVFIVPPTAATAPCSPTQETHYFRQFRHVWVVFAPPGTYEPPAALNWYREVLAAAGTSRVVMRDPGDSAVIEVDTSGRADGATSLPPVSWESGDPGCLNIYLYPKAAPKALK